MGTYFAGQWDYYWSWLDGGRRVGAKYEPKLDAALTSHCTIMRSIGWWYPFNDFCIVTDRPEIISRDARGRLDASNGPALKYRDGYTLHAVHGVRMPAELVEDHSKITVARIDGEQNAEVRRVLIGWYSTDRFMRDSGAKIVHQDKDPLGNPRRLMRRELIGDEPIVMIEVTDSTPQSDGTLKKYMLRVDPSAYDGLAGRECHAAIASTWRHKADATKLFFKRPTDYAPLVET